MGKTFQFTHVSESEDCGVIFYDRNTGSEVLRKQFSESGRVGNVYRMEITLEEGELLYQFYEGKNRFPDPRGLDFFATKKYGQEKAPEDVYTILVPPAFDWKGTENPKIPYAESLIYCLHVRGFTRHVSSGVKHRGTFSGVTEKIPYLREIGVTTLEFQPICEFIEKPAAMREQVAPAQETRLNYWGYVRGCYYAPKADYAWQDPTVECKEMIRALHEAGMEAVLQFYFPAEFNPMNIPEILRYWVEEYHVDGFHLIGENLPAELIARDPELSETKLWYYHMDGEAVYGKRVTPGYVNLGLLRDDFLYEGRRFLKGDENLVNALSRQMRSIPANVGKINYLSTYWGFTLMDAVSYDFKHNEANGEDNHDGTDYNCSWNCGEEGASRKKKILELRLTQLKNAFCLLFFAQGTPRIFMGDEFGNSQRGNNNPYCQDNEVTWLNWKNMEKHQELFSFFVKLVRIRRANPVLHPAVEARMMDSIACGYPELSFHGETAWKPQLENYSRQLGIAYCGIYQEKDLGLAVKKREPSDEYFRHDFLYLAMNSHWESHRLGLPRLPKDQSWQLFFVTSKEGAEKRPVHDAVTLMPKTMALYVSVPNEEMEK